MNHGSQPGLNRQRALSLAKTTGLVGRHHFYLGKPVLGVATLLSFIAMLGLIGTGGYFAIRGNHLFWYLLPAGALLLIVQILLIILDCRRLGRMSDEEFLMKYGSPSATDVPYTDYDYYYNEGAVGQPVAVQWPETPSTAYQPALQPADDYQPPAVAWAADSGQVSVQNEAAASQPANMAEYSVKPEEPAPGKPKPPQFFENSYMPVREEPHDMEDYVPGDDNYHPSVQDYSRAGLEPETAVFEAPQPVPESPSVPERASGMSMVKPFLLCLEGEFEGYTFDLDDGEIFLGRDPDRCQLVFTQETPFVSGKHCSIKYDGGIDQFHLTDAGSTNGTFLMQGEKLVPGQAYSLNPGESFYLGDKSVVFQVGKA